MSVGSFSASLSGLNANQQRLAVIGNNLANINTVAFKASTVSFADLVSQSVGGASTNPMQIGLGVATGSISPNFSQGGIENTGVATNVAIQGNGFFVVGNAANRSYSRAGNFTFDADGTLITVDGQNVQGYTAVDPVTGAIITTGQPSDIVVPPGLLRAPVGTTSFATGTQFSAAVQIFDALGVPHVATVKYAKTGAGAWGYSVTVPGQEIAGGTAGTPFQIASGTMTFDGLGKMLTVNGGAPADVTITSPAWANGAAATNFTWDLIDANGVATVSGYSSPSATS